MNQNDAFEAFLVGAQEVMNARLTPDTPKIHLTLMDGDQQVVQTITVQRKGVHPGFLVSLYVYGELVRLAVDDLKGVAAFIHGVCHIKCRKDSYVQFG